MRDISFEHLPELSTESTAENYKTKRLLRNTFLYTGRTYECKMQTYIQNTQQNVEHVQVRYLRPFRING